MFTCLPHSNAWVILCMLSYVICPQNTFICHLSSEHMGKFVHVTNFSHLTSSYGNIISCMSQILSIWPFHSVCNFMYVTDFLHLTFSMGMQFHVCYRFSPFDLFNGYAISCMLQIFSIWPFHMGISCVKGWKFWFL
jgi:hypothetical protein